mgnify:CR=1 FL=1
MIKNFTIELVLPCFKPVSAVLTAWMFVILYASPAKAVCAAPAPVCAAKAGVFAIQSFHPTASATRIGPNLLVTNRHVVVNQATAHVMAPNGARLNATVVPSSYPGDLILLRVPDLPPGPILAPIQTPTAKTTLHAIGYDVGRQEIRIYAPGQIIAIPPTDATLARVHHDAPSQPGNSGGALVNAEGHLLAIVAAGGVAVMTAFPPPRLKDWNPCLVRCIVPPTIKSVWPIGNAWPQPMQPGEAADHCPRNNWRSWTNAVGHRKTASFLTWRRKSSADGVTSTNPSPCSRQHWIRTQTR